MTEIEEGDLRFSFPDHCEVGKYDDWAFYRNQFQSVAGRSKAVDILCVADDAAWLIEVKDYRQHPRTKPSDLGDELARKVRDTLAGLAAASKNANCQEERALAKRALERRRWRVALHLEQPRVGWRFRPINPASVLAQIRRSKLKAVDPHPMVLHRETHRPDIPWTVQ